MTVESLPFGTLICDIAVSNPSTNIPPQTAIWATNDSTEVRLGDSTEPAKGEAEDPANACAAEMLNLSDDQVIQQVLTLNRKQHLINVELLVYLGELDSRRLYRNSACSSMFEYLMARLGQTEDVAYRWMWGARLLRAYPLVHELLGNGWLHLSSLMVLKPYLTEENHQDMLLAASGKSKREIEKLVAARFPKPDAPARVRKLPNLVQNRGDQIAELAITEGDASPGELSPGVPSSATATPAATATSSATATPAATATSSATATPAATATSSATATPAATATSSATATPAATATSSATATAAATATSSGSGLSLDVFDQLSPQTRPTPNPSLSTRATKIQPLSEHSYRVIFTASERLKEKLDRAGELVSHAVSAADLPAVIERALDLLLEHEERRRYGVHRQTKNSMAPTTALDLRTTKRLGDSRTTNGRNSSTTTESMRPTEKVIIAEGASSETGIVAKAASSETGIIAAPGLRDSTKTLSARTPSIATSAHKNTAVDGAPECHLAHSRYVPVEVRRQVWERDAGQCTFVDSEGRRCQCRHRLEFDHRVAHALGGPPTIENIRLRCKAHNALAAEQVFGVERIASTITAARQQRRRPGATAHRESQCEAK